jgi:large subunit ribosomal protein L23
MALLDRFKKKEEKKKNTQKEENVLEMVQEPKTNDQQPAILKENTGLAHRILKHHHLSEKTNFFAASGRYVFKVDSSANKIEVKKAVEKVYDVHVTKVNIVNVFGKSRRQGKTMGRTQNWKKAIVTLKNGERISGLAEGV